MSEFKVSEFKVCSWTTRKTRVTWFVVRVADNAPVGEGHPTWAEAEAARAMKEMT